MRIKSTILIIAVASIAATQAWAQSSGFGLSAGAPIQLDGDKLEIFEDQGLAVFQGSVTVIQEDKILKTSKLDIYYAKDGEGSIATGAADIDHLVASGGVNMTSGSQVATGETGTYDMRTETLVLTGNPVTLTEAGNVATGCKLTFYQGTGRAHLEGCGKNSRPTVLIQPKNK